jgi:hypothetical protein
MLLFFFPEEMLDLSGRPPAPDSFLAEEMKASFRFLTPVDIAKAAAFF